MITLLAAAALLCVSPAVALVPPGLGSVLTVDPAGSPVTSILIEQIAGSGLYHNQMVLYASDLTTIISTFGSSDANDINNRQAHSVTVNNLNLVGNTELGE